MSRDLKARLAALEGAAPRHECSDLARAVFDAFWLASASDPDNAAAALRLAASLEAGAVEDFSPLIRASPERAAAIARAAARGLTTI